MTETTKRKDVTSFKASCSALVTLTKMQLQEKMDLSYLRSFKATLFKVIFTVLEFVAVTAVCAVLFWLCQLFGIFDPLNKRIPTNILVTVLAVMMALSVVFTTAGLVKSLYLSKDNLVLLTFPSTPTVVFLSKLLVYYVYELKKNFTFLTPFFIAYGITLGYPVYYHLWAVALFLLLAALPVLVGALLSMPALFGYQLIKKSKILQTAIFVAFYAAVIALALKIIGAIPEEINFLKAGIPTKEINAFTAAVANGFPPVAWLTKLIIGTPYASTMVDGIATTMPVLFSLNTLWVFLGLVGSIAALIAVGLLLAQPLFYKMASKPFEFAKKTKIEAKSNVKAPVLLSAVKKEWLVSLRNGSLVSLLSQLVVVLPLAIAFLNGLYEAMNISALGVQMTVAFNFAIVMLFMLSTSVTTASSYSKDGYAAYLNKVQPSSYGSLLVARLTVNLAAGLVGVIATTVTYSFYAVAGSVNLVLFAAVTYAVFVAHLFWSAEMDLMNPQYEQYATFSEQSNNPNENKSSLLSLLLSVLFALCLFLLMPEGVTLAWWKALGVAIALAAFKIFTFFLKIKTYYKEK